MLVDLTDQGREILLADRRRRDAWLAQRLRELTPDERALLREAAPLIQRLATSLSPTFRSLHNHNYRLYATGGVVSNTGTWMQRVAQDWLVVVLAVNDGIALGITTGLQFLPALLLSPYAGLIADRFPKQRLLQVTQTVMAVTALLLGVLAVTGTVEVWHVYVLAFVFGVGSAFDAPARQSFVSEMVDPEDLSNAVGLNSASFNAARVAGPALAGLLIGAFGGGAEATGWVILLNGLSYAAVVLALRRMVVADLHPSPREARHKGMILRRRALPARPPGPDADPVHRVLRRHLRAQLPADLGPDGDAGCSTRARRSTACSARRWPSAR